MKNFPSLNNNVSLFRNSEIQDVSKNNLPDGAADVGKLSVDEKKSSLESARKKRANTNIIFRSDKTDKSINLLQSVKTNYENDGQIFYDESEKSNEKSEEENSSQIIVSDLNMKSSLSPRSDKLDSPYKNNKKNSTQALANMSESDGALLSEADKKSESKARRSQFRLPTLSFGKNTETMNAEPGSARSNRSNSFRHLNSFTSGIISPRSTLNESDSSDGGATVLSGQPVSPRALHSGSNKSIMPATPRQSPVSLTSIFGSSEVDPAEKQRKVISSISKSQWRISNISDVEVKGTSVINRVSNSVRNLLSDDYRSIILGQTFQTLPLHERDYYLKQELGSRFISHVLREQGDNFDPSLLKSGTKLSVFLKKNFGITIEKKSVEKESKDYKNTDEAPDFLQIILDDVVLHSVNYSIERTIDLTNQAYLKHYDDCKNSSFENTKNNKTDSVGVNQRSDLSATFLRDFPHSVYQAELDDSSLKAFSSPDDFFDFIGDPKSNRFPELISHYSNQNIGTFLNRALFSKIDTKGMIDSEIHTADGLPLVPTSSPKASYIFKKLANGDVILKYTGKIDTRVDEKIATERKALMKQTAKIFIKDGDSVIEKRFTMKNADAEIKIEILFSIDGTVTLNNPTLKAKGWSRLPEDN